MAWNGTENQCLFFLSPEADKIQWETHQGKVEPTALYRVLGIEAVTLDLSVGQGATEPKRK